MDRAIEHTGSLWDANIRMTALATDESPLRV